MVNLDPAYIEKSILIAENLEKLEYWLGYITALFHCEKIDENIYQNMRRLIESCRSTVVDLDWW